MEEILEKFEKAFKERGDLDIVDNTNYYSDEIGSHYEYNKDLSIVMITDVITEMSYYGDEIKVNPILFKANSIDEAWDKIKKYVKEEIEYWAKNWSDYEDFRKDENFMDFLERVITEKD